MRFAYDWVPATFISRPNRFIAWFRAGDADVKAHVPNTGRLRELLVPGAEVLLSHHGEPHRKTAYELRLVKAGAAWVSIDSQLPNRIVEEGLREGLIDDFGPVRAWRREVAYGNSRLDFQVESDREWLIEVKGVTLQEDGWSYFPDAPTERGARHVNELAERAAQGGCAAVLFLVQHPEARGFTPNGRMDPAFAEAVRRAREAGVRLVAWKCRVSPEAVELWERIPIRLWEETHEDPVPAKTRKSRERRL